MKYKLASNQELRINSDATHFLTGEVLRSGIAAAMPEYNFEASPIVCDFFFDEHFSKNGKAAVSCSLICHLNKKAYTNISLDSSHRRALDKCQQAIIRKLSKVLPTNGSTSKHRGNQSPAPYPRYLAQSQEERRLQQLKLISRRQEQSRLDHFYIVGGSDSEDIDGLRSSHHKFSDRLGIDE